MEIDEKEQEFVDDSLRSWLFGYQRFGMLYSMYASCLICCLTEQVPEPSFLCFFYMSGWTWS